MTFPSGIGAVIAIVVLVVVIVLALIGQLPMVTALLLAALAVTRLT